MLPPFLLGVDCLSRFLLGGPGPPSPSSLELTPLPSSPRQRPIQVSGTCTVQDGMSVVCLGCHVVFWMGCLLGVVDGICCVGCDFCWVIVIVCVVLDGISVRYLGWYCM